MDRRFLCNFSNYPLKNEDSDKVAKIHVGAIKMRFLKNFLILFALILTLSSIGNAQVSHLSEMVSVLRSSAKVSSRSSAWRINYTDRSSSLHLYRKIDSGDQMEYITFVIEPTSLKPSEGKRFFEIYAGDFFDLLMVKKRIGNLLNKAMSKSGVEVVDQFANNTRGHRALIKVKSAEDLQNIMKELDEMALEIETYGPYYWK